MIDIEKLAAEVKRHADEQIVTGNEPTWCHAARSLADIAIALDARLRALEAARGKAPR